MREPKVLVGGDGVPREMIGGQTQRLDTSELYGLIEKSEGIEAAQRFANGTPGTGLPQLEEDVVVEARPAVLPTTPRSTRLRDFMLGGLISLSAMIAWYCATQL